MMTDEKFTAILECLRDGLSLRKSVKQHATTVQSFLYYVDKDVNRGDQYARAREIGLEKLADEILEISDDGTNDKYIDEDGKEVVNHDHIQRSKLRVDSRKWILSKQLPKKYGDRQAIDHNGKIELTAEQLLLKIVDGDDIDE